MQIKVRPDTRPAAGVLALFVGAAILAWAYLASPAPADAKFMERLTSGSPVMSLAVIAGVLALMWGTATIISETTSLRRMPKVDEIATQMGLARVTRESDLFVSGLDDVRVLRYTMNFVLSGTVGGADVLLGHFVTGGDPSYPSAVACFRLSRTLPSFELAPESLADKLASALGAQDIDFDSHPEFSKAYRLHSTDEAATRAFFGNSALVSYLVADKGWSVQSSGGWLAVYRPAGHIRLAELPRFLERATSLLEAAEPRSP